MRELEEETGFKCEHLEFLLYVNTTVAFLDEKIGIYLAKDLEKGQMHWDEDEELGVEAWKLEDLQQLIYEGKMTDGKTVAAIQTYAAKYHK
jgi:ADP-ribose pyrophosphatase